MGGQSKQARTRGPRRDARLVRSNYLGLSREDALRRERSLKSGKGKRYLRSRLVAFLSSLSRNKLEWH